MNNFVRFVSVALVILSSACGSSNVAPPPGANVPLVRLRSDPYSFAFVSGFDQPARLVVRDPVTWHAVWNQIYLGGSPVPPLPEIDFSQEMLVVVALGSHPTGGYGILLTGASESADGIEVAVLSSSPGPKCFTTQAFTQPVDVARLPRRQGAVHFVERSEVFKCE